MATYDLIQLSNLVYPYYAEISAGTRCVTISEDGTRVVYAEKIDLDNPVWAVWFYDKESGNDSRPVMINVDGEDHLIRNTGPMRPQITGDGNKIVFDGCYKPEAGSGIFLYDIASNSVRQVALSEYPVSSFYGEPGRRKYINSTPSISSDGSTLAYVVTDHEYSGSTWNRWAPTRQRLMIAKITSDNVAGGTILEIQKQNHFGDGIHSVNMSGDGQHITFYAGGVLEGLVVSNMQMPPYETTELDRPVAPYCKVYCYIVHIGGPGQYTLEVVPEPDDPRRPLCVANNTGSGNTFRNGGAIGSGAPPSITRNGSRVALTAGLEMGSPDTGIYLYEPYGSNPGTQKLITFGERPGEAPGERTLSTGVCPAISPDGSWLAFNRRVVTFREGYADSSRHMDDHTYCPTVLEDDVQVSDLPIGDISSLIQSDDYPGTGCTISMSIALSQDADHVAFVSRANKTGSNLDRSHEVYYGTLVS